MEEKNKITNKEEVKEEKAVKPKKKKKDNETTKYIEEIASLKEKNLRIQAEMQNFKKRQEDEVERIRKYKNEDILKSLLTIKDNFERALSYKNKDNEEIFKGFEMINNSILNILKDNNVTEIESDGCDFNPNIHQAVFTEHKEGIEPNKVIETLQKGYMYKDRVLRVSMVKVSE